MRRLGYTAAATIMRYQHATDERDAHIANALSGVRDAKLGMLAFEATSRR
jgi:hypothetical protein